MKGDFILGAVLEAFYIHSAIQSSTRPYSQEMARVEFGCKFLSLPI